MLINELDGVMKTVRRILPILAILVIISLVPQANANPSIDTWDAAKGPDFWKDQFTEGEDVGITVNCAGNYGPYEIILLYPNGTVKTVAQGLVGPIKKVYPGSTMTPEHGTYEVSAGSASTHYATAVYFVVPEAPLGVVAALVACLAALGYKRLRIH